MHMTLCMICKLHIPFLYDLQAQGLAGVLQDAVEAIEQVLSLLPHCLQEEASSRTSAIPVKHQQSLCMLHEAFTAPVPDLVGTMLLPFDGYAECGQAALYVAKIAAGAPEVCIWNCIHGCFSMSLFVHEPAQHL